MSRWFRFYSGVVTDPKAQMLSPEMFKHWVNVLCIAAQHDGELPPIAVTAYTLRLTEAKAAGILAKLHAADLLDKTTKSFKPHNWDSRQYKQDAADPTNADRQKRYRDRKRNGNSNGDSNGEDNAVTPVSTKRPEYTEDTNDRIGSAGARVLTPGSKALTDALWSALGIDSPLQVPPELCGTDWHAIKWEAAGWTPDLIASEARRIGPGKPLTYYEKVFATAFAKRQAPLPTVEIRQSEKFTVTHGTSSQGGSLIGAIDRQLAELERAQDADPSLSARSVLRISH